MRPSVLEPRSVRHGATQRRLIINRFARFVDYLFGLLYTFLLVRLLLELLGTGRPSAFLQSLRALTDPAYAPFKLIIGTRFVGGTSTIWSLMLAVLGYALLQALLHGLLRVISRRSA